MTRTGRLLYYSADHWAKAYDDFLAYTLDFFDRAQSFTWEGRFAQVNPTRLERLEYITDRLLSLQPLTSWTDNRLRKDDAGIIAGINFDAMLDDAKAEICDRIDELREEVDIIAWEKDIERQLRECSTPVIRFDTSQDNELDKAIAKAKRLEDYIEFVLAEWEDDHFTARYIAALRRGDYTVPDDFPYT
jgi:hypothetical protein